MPEINPNNDRLDSLPPPVLDAYRRFHATGDPGAFRSVLLHLMIDFKPEWAEHPPDTLADPVLLVEDLGYNSLAIAEMVFYFEDLFGVSINNAELRNLASVGDLRRFVYGKIRGA